MASEPGTLLRSASWLGRSVPTTWSLDNSARTRTPGFDGSMVATCTAWMRSPLVRMVPLLWVIPGARVSTWSGVYAVVTFASATCPDNSPSAAARVPSITQRGRVVMVVRRADDAGCDGMGFTWRGSPWRDALDERAGPYRTTLVRTAQPAEGPPGGGSDRLRLVWCGAHGWRLVSLRRPSAGPQGGQR